ncbi:MAG: DUF2520 domain-containing protein [Syntrophaceae bacterium]|jgi:predicted short-subunit dehydrogenase-like oxidoreductase (DUF2520 family)|nr:DUF2520 domain-containing protein [Syntrophaceae bacterium]HOC59930.1 DUF2520 domain-containing protein [Smithellaceae bacterium]HQM44295.1 DUF2520 domain-containing protein [Smithellaceae bacterium]
MKTRKPQKFSVIGAGMVGTAIGFLLKKAGHHIVSFVDVSQAHLKRAQKYTGAPGFHKPVQAAEKADCLLITTPDDRIRTVCAEIATHASLQGKKVLHMSGAGGLDLLDHAVRAGGQVASIHPLQSFSSIEGAIASIPGSYFGVTAAKGAKKFASSLVRDLGGIPMEITPEQKPLYHAAACIASNYLVSLMSVVESIYRSIGFSDKDARKAYLPLVYGSLANIKNQGCEKALTGPIARGDAGTIQKHIKAMASHHPDLSPLYTNMGFIAVNLARRKGALNTEQANFIQKLLKGAKNEHTNENQPENSSGHQKNENLGRENRHADSI